MVELKQNIRKIYEDPSLKDGMETKIKYLKDDIDIDGMTIHKSKGLTSDEVIIIGLDEDFPMVKGKFLDDRNI